MFLRALREFFFFYFNSVEFEFAFVEKIYDVMEIIFIHAKINDGCT